MTTAVRPQHLQNEEGQSIIEFLLMIPLMVGLSVLLIRVNTVIQMAIVNQQHARAHALHMAYNSSQFPALGLRISALNTKGFNQVLMGVSEDSTLEGDVEPNASTHKITRQKGGSTEAKNESIRERSDVRVRNTVSLCSQINVVASGSTTGAALDLQASAPYRATSVWKLDENVQFDYCRSPMEFMNNE